MYYSIQIMIYKALQSFAYSFIINFERYFSFIYKLLERLLIIEYIFILYFGNTIQGDYDKNYFFLLYIKASR